jgi:hypothetical protein
MTDSLYLDDLNTGQRFGSGQSALVNSASRVDPETELYVRKGASIINFPTRFSTTPLLDGSD